jgi:thiamine phosphate synthase YjbQ (UPF0047 family)
VIKIYTKKFSEQTAGFCDIIDLTAKVRAQIENGRPLLGPWQQLVLLDFDNRPPTREIIVQLIGENE